MELLLWRHADAADGFPDPDRPLTPKGEKQAKQMARWLRQRLPAHARILVSPALRARQTAQTLGLEFEESAAVGTAAGANEVLAAAGWPDAGGAVLVVGHQPTLGRVAALLLSGEAADWTIKKGALWWLSRPRREAGSGVVLRAVIGPDLCLG